MRKSCHVPWIGNFQCSRCSKLKKGCHVPQISVGFVFFGMFGGVKVSNMGWNGYGRFKQLCTSNSISESQEMSGLEKSCENIVDGHDPASWDGFSWNKSTIITTSPGSLLSPSMICRTSLWTIGACPFLSLQRRPLQPHGSAGGVCGCHWIIHYSVDGTLVVFDVGVADCRP